MAYCVALECFDWSVLAQFTHVNAHVRAAGGKRVVALPVHIQSRSCRRKMQITSFMTILLKLADVQPVHLGDKEKVF